MSATFVIPARNEADTIGVLVERIKNNCPGSPIIVVDDASTDGTDQAARGAGALVGNTFNRRCGSYARAVLLGLRMARGYSAQAERVIVIDAGGAWDPLECISYMAVQKEVIIGTRYYSRAKISRQLLTWAAARVTSKITGRNVEDATAGFRMYSMHVVLVLLRAEDHLETLSGHWFNAAVLIYLAKLGVTFGEMPVSYRGGSNRLSIGEVLRAVRDAWRSWRAR